MLDVILETHVSKQSGSLFLLLKKELTKGFRVLENVHTDLHGFLHVVGDTYFTGGLHKTMNPVCRPVYVGHVTRLAPLAGVNGEGGGKPFSHLLAIHGTEGWFKGGDVAYSGLLHLKSLARFFFLTSCMLIIHL